MKRILFLILTVFLLSSTSNAAHIKGGFFSYRYIGPGAPGNAVYQVTLTVYMICNPSTAQVSNPINFSIFNGSTNQFLQNVSVSLQSQYNLTKNFDEPCITGNETGCYYTVVVYQLNSIELPITTGGYTFSYQRCCRIAGIINVPGSGAIGNTFSIKIPGTATAPGAETNNSPAFQVNDTAVVCRNSFFQYSFQATDFDGDSLSYQFCSALDGASQSVPAPPTATNPPYFSVPYASPFSGSQPMGPGVTINPVTGLISGIAPDLLGEFVVSVCVNEYRNGVYLGTTQKELHIRVNDCQPLQAKLDPSIITCDGFSLNFQNLVTNPAGAEFIWTFGEPASGSANTSTLANPTHTYADTGVYIVKLVVSLAGGLCADSTTMQAKVFPGFFPNFTAAGGCFTNPFQFTDLTSTVYGVVDSWRWNFGDLSTAADTSRNQNPQWTYPTAGTKTAQLIVTNSKGCKDTASVDVEVFDKPPITLGFRDTLICVPDAVMLNASGNGIFSWTPTININNPNIATPTVNPTTSTWYTVNLNDNGCLNKDSVNVRVITNVSLSAIADTTICLTDAVQLNATTDGLSFQWTPAGTLDNPNIRNPIATPTTASTNYQITARVGSCSATDNVVITTVPYPVANAGADQTICYNTSALLNGSHDGISFTWSPVLYLDDPAVLNPVSTPPRTTSYILTALDNAGCPKPGRDTVVITVQPKVRASAGRDTTVVIGQPLLLQGSGGVSYVWSPNTGLSNTTIANPIGVYGPETDSVRYKLVVTDAAGCPDSAFVTVYVFKTNPYVFVPTAFTPNNDGKNDVIRPIAVGVEKINFFSIYNRWG
ncbi:MAG TPA: PKD domain-containing protein, partial [Chitinophagaceae bacterium]|nr:PKD domain-containing protein [Chitinophagaceae bacterium]HQZ51523.1 PKD domain-containing protein [Chitinophagaceae bacterium]